MRKPSGTKIFNLVEEICAFGPRWMGTSGADMVVNFISDHFAASGLKVELQPFQYLSYSPGKASIAIDGCELSCEPIAYSKPTTRTLTAPLVSGGQCLPQDFEFLKAKGIEIAGSIVVSENLRSFDAYPSVEAAGAAGFVSATLLPDNAIRCGCARVDRVPGGIPAVAIGGDDARFTLSELEKGRLLEASMEVGGNLSERQGCNVIGKKEDHGTPRILLTAHYDSFWNGVHAMDNAAGVSTVIALSQILSKTTSHNIEFVVFGGEELGFWGSSGYVKKLGASTSAIEAIINLDAFGSNRSQIEIGATPDLVDFCQTISEKENVQVDCWNVPPRPASDQHCFVQKGVSAIWISNCGADQRYHTALDVPSQMSSQKLEIAAQLAFSLIQGLLEN